MAETFGPERSEEPNTSPADLPGLDLGPAVERLIRTAPEQPPEEEQETKAATEVPQGPDSGELRRRELVAGLAGNLLQESGIGGTEDMSGIDLDRLEAGLRSDDPVKRAQATNVLRLAMNVMEHSYSPELPEKTADELLDAHSLAPSEARELVGAIKEAQDDEEELTAEESLVAAVVNEYGSELAEQADAKGKLLETGAILGAQNEHFFAEQLAQYDRPVELPEADAFFGLSAAERSAAVSGTFGKLRRRAMRHLNIPPAEVSR